ncbi:hypothetical protein [Jiangella asiatica]|uniref:hypothetical protein n=1 Tax=Jiangella asiatica TaxID=2530372 RepID=UPI0013A5CCC3|nr:hypothetical protein [Jiangella asiatica]
MKSSITGRRARRARLLPVLALLLTVSLTACGSDGDDDVSAAGTGGGGESVDDGDVEDDELAFYECMREHGVDMPDPDPNQQGVQLTLPDDPDAEAAMEECRSLLPNGGEMPEQDAESLESLRAFTECMRENGVDMPDPNADGSLSMPAGLDPNSAAFQTAISACQSLLAGVPVRFGPGGGGQ